MRHERMLLAGCGPLGGTVVGTACGPLLLPMMVDVAGAVRLQVCTAAGAAGGMRCATNLADLRGPDRMGCVCTPVVDMLAHQRCLGGRGMAGVGWLQLGLLGVWMKLTTAPKYLQCSVSVPRCTMNGLLWASRHGKSSSHW